jgi:ectoine hydroxylase-related dioxygenase (phytanoyl-CoA dioxygenase family)
MLPLAARRRLAEARGQMERAMRRVLHGGAPSWHRVPNRLPWFDQPDALAQVGQHASDAAEAERFAQWVRDGYFAVSGLVDPADVDAMVAVLDGLWDAPAPLPGLTLLDLREDAAAPPRNLSHAEVLALPSAARARMRVASDWRIHGFHYVNAPAARLFHHRGLRRLVSRLFGRTAKPFAAINFMAGSQQHLHQDMAVFHIHPHDYLVGAWIACEDISPQSGPLVFHPGSHRAGMFPGFPDYPQTNLRTADAGTTHAYEAWVETMAAGHSRHEFLARKGDVLFWHGMLLHGGAPVLRSGVSRKSMVLHYTVRGADRGREVRGPFNW